MKTFKRIILGLGALSLSGCGATAEFKGKNAIKIIESSNSIPSSALPSNDVKAGKPAVATENEGQINYTLSVADGSVVAPQKLATALPGLIEVLSNNPLSPENLKEWKVKIHAGDDASGSETAIEKQNIDLSSLFGPVVITADFRNTRNGRTGKATQSIFIDGEAPKVKLLRMSDAKDGLTSQISWSATDNYKVDESKLVLLGCSDFMQTFQPKTRTDLDVLPSGCVIVSQGTDLLALSATPTLSAITIGAAKILPSDIRFALYAQDTVGLSAFTWISNASQEAGSLILSASPSGTTYSNSKTASMKLKLLEITGGSVSSIDDVANSARWSSFALSTATTPAANTPHVLTFNPSVPLQLGPNDGAYTFVAQVKGTSPILESNKQTVTYIYDTTAPKIDTIQITINKTIPSPESTVSVTWNASDLNGIASQSVEIKGTTATAWTKVATISATQRTASFNWGTRLSENFQIRVSASDPAGNTGSASAGWVKQIFNAAVLTSNTQCFFCHIKIEGDVGGIDLPSVIGRTDTGKNFDVLGKIYGTGVVPDLLGKHATATVPNYDNKDYKIFPKDEKFPVIDASSLKAKMLGSITLGSLQIANVYNGNLVLDGSTASGPFTVKGEVFIDGDLIIKGKYKGVGSIYAKNIFIVNDLTAVKSPFPFDTDPAVAIVQAQASVVRGDDGLYLGALGEIIVGNTEVKILQDAVSKIYYTNANPYAWYTQAQYFALGTQAAIPKKKDGTVVTGLAANYFSGDPTTSNKVRNEVNRVDAYLYAQTRISWRAYNNILLNGGFMSPVGGFLSSVPSLTYTRLDLADFALNPRNGKAVNQSLVQYDYRLRIGGGGFETIKSFFDQQ